MCRRRPQVRCTSCRGQPVMDPPPRIIREIKFGGDNGPRPEAAKVDFALKTQVRDLFAQLEALATFRSSTTRSGRQRNDDSPSWSSKTLLAPRRPVLLTRLGLLTRGSESSRPFFRPAGGTILVAFEPQSLTRETQSPGAGSRNAVTLCQRRDMRTPGQLPGRAFALTGSPAEVRSGD